MLSELTPEDASRLEDQRKRIRVEVRARYGRGLGGGLADLALLQRLLDDKVFSPTERYELQCIGICFGDILCCMAPFRWVMIADEHGRDPTLQWKQTTIHAMTVISKRVEDSEDVDVAWLADKLVQRATELEARAS